MAERTCSIAGCGDLVRARGWCSTHYQRWRKAEGITPENQIRGRPALVLFWENVDKRGADECWPWLGTRSDEGYGRHRWTDPDGRQYAAAHRYAYELLVGPIAEGLTLDHVCHGPSCTVGRECPHRRCVNPRHLAPSTNSANAARRFYVRSCKHCGQLLEMTPAGRRCLACRDRRRQRHPLTCQQCGAIFEWTTNGRRPVYCSIRCRNRADYLRRQR